MDSLLANYSSSDEEDDQSLNSNSTSKHGGISNSMPPPKSSLFSTLPPPKFSPNTSSQPKSEQDHSLESSIPKPKPSLSSLLAASLPLPKSSFSSLLAASLPQPKSSSSLLSSTEPSPKLPAPKKTVRVVQLKAPTALKTIDEDDSKEEDEGEKEKQRKRLRESMGSFSGTSKLPGLLPPPKKSSTSLGTLGTGRKSMFETVASVSSGSSAGAVQSVTVAQSGSSVGFMEDQTQKGYDIGVESDVGVSGVQSGGMSYNYTNSDTYGAEAGGSVDYSYGDSQHVSVDGNYADYVNNTPYENNWANETVLPDISQVMNELRVPGKRGRRDAIPEIVEVNQDELMKNRPRDDKSKATAVGPAYQPTASTKGKPTKLHKRKHQIGSLYFDMRQKESELAERRGQGFQTKAQTQRKYGWS